MTEKTPLLAHSTVASTSTQHYAYVEDQAFDQELVCPICYQPFSNAVRSVTCGHTFCKACIDRWADMKTVRTCPLDHKPLDQLQSDRLANNLTNKFVVQCLHCPSWTGAKLNLATHLKDTHNLIFIEDSGTYGYPQAHSISSHAPRAGPAQVIVMPSNFSPCYFHPQTGAIATCTRCSRNICSSCVRATRGQCYTADFVCFQCHRNITSYRVIASMISFLLSIILFVVIFIIINNEPSN